MFLDSAPFPKSLQTGVCLTRKIKIKVQHGGTVGFGSRDFTGNSFWEFMDSPSRGSEQMSGFTPEKQKRLLNLKIALEKEKHRPKPPIFGFHVSFRGWYFNFVRLWSPTEWGGGYTP